MAFYRRTTRSRTYSRRPYRSKRSYKRRPVTKRRTRRKYSRSSITTGTPMRKFIKVKKEFILTQTTNSTSNSFLYSIAGQNPNGGSIRWYNGQSASQIGQDNTSCAGINEWFSFYEDCFVRGCKVVAQIANNSPDGAIIVDYGPTVGSILAGSTLAASPYDASDIQPAELPMFRRSIIGGSNSRQTGTVKFYMPIKRLLGVKNLEDVFFNGTITNNETGDPKVPNFESIIDPTGQTLEQASVFGNVVLTTMAGFTSPPPADPIAPAHSIRFLVTYYLNFRNRRVLTGGVPS